MTTITWSHSPANWPSSPGSGVSPPNLDALAGAGAERVLNAYETYSDGFREINSRARSRFEARDWQGLQDDAVERLELYPRTLDPAVEDIRGILGDQVESSALWVALKDSYSDLISGRADWELAETFHNSVTRKVFTTVGVESSVEFVDTDFDTAPPASVDHIFKVFDAEDSTQGLVREALLHFSHDVGYADLDRDVVEVATRINERLENIGSSSVDRVELIHQIFYRGQAGYVIGLIHADAQQIPVAMVLRNGPHGILVDAVLLTENEVSILFSFTRSYFHVNADRPSDLIAFLKRLMPLKRIAELYISIGHNKHGKTELYRDLLRHLRSSEEQFEKAPGTPGLVMIVFTLPGYDDVFKVIRDTFPPPKRTTRRAIMEKYRLVFQHDRAGRLMDVQDFQHLEFARDRFDEALLGELVDEAGSSVEVAGDSVIVKHVYVERRIVPLDVFVREADSEEAAAAVVDYGQAIKDLASTNIFPGDLLVKNFGVTRHGRVVFYDYDELSALTDINFRMVPQPRNDFEAMSDEPWYAAADRDVFPEEHRQFLGLSTGLRSAFEAAHGDLFLVAPWKAIQDRIEDGELIEVFPYRERARLPGTEVFKGW